MSDPKDAQPPATPDASKTKISLDRASREELVEFVKKQNVHTKKLEAKYAELATQFKTQTTSLKAAEKQVADLRIIVSDPQEITRLREAETRITRRVRDLEDTLQADAEFKRSLQSNIEELYKERKAAKAAAESQIAALQADLTRLQSGGPAPAGADGSKSEAMLNETNAALAAARAEVESVYERARGAETRMKEAIAERDALQKQLTSEVSVLKAHLAEATATARKETSTTEQSLRSEVATLQARVAEHEMNSQAVVAKHAQELSALQEQLAESATKSREVSLGMEQQSEAQKDLEERSRSVTAKEEAARVHGEALERREEAQKAKEAEWSTKSEALRAREETVEKREEALVTKSKSFEMRVQEVKRRAEDVVRKEQQLREQQSAEADTNASLQARVTALQQELSASQAAQLTAADQLDEIQRKLDAEKQSATRADSAYAIERERLQEQNAELHRLLQSHADEAKRRAEEIKKIAEERHNAQEEKQKAESAAAASEAEHKRLESELSKLQQAVLNAHHSAEQQAHEASRKLEEERRKIESGESTSATERKRLQEENARLLQAQEGEHNHAEEAKSAFEKERQKLAAELKTVAAALKRAEEERARWQQEAEEGAQDIQASTAAMNAAKQEARKAQELIAAAEAKAAELLEARMALQAENQDLKDQLTRVPEPAPAAIAAPNNPELLAQVQAAREDAENKVAQLSTLLTKAKKAFQEKKGEEEARVKALEEAIVAQHAAEKRATDAEAKLQEQLAKKPAEAESPKPNADSEKVISRLRQEKEALEQLVGDLRSRVDDMSRSGRKSPIPTSKEVELAAQVEEAKEAERRAVSAAKLIENKFQFLHSSNEEVEKALAQANKDRETLFQRCVELTAQVQGNEDRLKRAVDSEVQVVDLKNKLTEIEKERDKEREKERERELSAPAVPAALDLQSSGGKPEEGKDEALEVKLLQEKITYLKSLLARSNQQSKEQKRVVSELQRRIAELEAQQVAQRTVDVEVGQKAQASMVESNRLHDQLQTYKNKILALDGELANVRGELSKTLDEFRAYKLRAQTVVAQSLKGAAPQRAAEAEDMALDLRQEVASLKKKIHELVTYNSELETYQKSAQAIAEDLARHEEQEAKLGQSLAAAKASARREEEAWREKFQALVNERQDLITKHSETLIEVEMRNAEKFEELRVQLRTFREKSQAAVAEKEGEVTRLKQEIAALQAAKQQAALLQSIALREAKAQEAAAVAAQSLANNGDNGSNLERSPGSSPQLPLNATLPPAAAGSSGVLHYAQMQAVREEELATLKTSLVQAQDSAREAEEMMRLHNLQEAALKKEIRELERTKKRDGANLEYLKNIVLKYMETQEHEKLMPVLTTLLQFSPEEVSKVQEARTAQQGSGLWGYVGWGAAKPATK